MFKLFTVVFVFSMSHSAVIGQDCFEQDLNIHDIESKTKELEFITFFENDSIRKICWWETNTFHAEVYNGKKTLTIQIFKETPLEYKSDSLTYRGHALSNDFFINNKKIEFYGLCD